MGEVSGLESANRITTIVSVTVYALLVISSLKTSIVEMEVEHLLVVSHWLTLSPAHGLGRIVVASIQIGAIEALNLSMLRNSSAENVVTSLACSLDTLNAFFLLVVMLGADFVFVLESRLTLEVIVLVLSRAVGIEEASAGLTSFTEPTGLLVTGLTA